MKRLFLAVVIAFLFGTALAQTEIEFWHAFGDAARSGWIEERAAEWSEQNPDYNVVVESKGSYRDTLNAAILAARQGEPPHVVQIFEVGSQQALDSGQFEPVGAIPGSFDTSDYIEPVLNYYTIDGQVNSIPFNSSSPILYTNRDLMREAGLDPDSPPQTYGEILEACEAAEEAGIGASCIGFNLHSWFFEQWMAQQGAPLVNNDNGREARATETLLTSEAAKTIVEWIKTLNDEGYYTYTGKLEDWSGSDAIFTEGEAMFHITSTAEVGNIIGAAGDSFEVGTGVLPIADDVERNGVVIGGASVWIMQGHPEDELEAARDFVLYMTNPENMVSWHKLTGYYPVRTSSVDMLTEEGFFDENPRYEVAFNQLLETEANSATAGALMGPFPEVRTIIEEAIQRVLNGQDVDTVLAEAKTLADAALEEYNSNF